MAFGEKEFAKTFDSAKGDFVILKGKHDLDALERIRFLDSQLNLLYSKIEKLQKMISLGISPFGSAEAARRIEGFHKRHELLESKMGLYGVLIDEVRSNILGIHDSLNIMASTSELEGIFSKLGDMEKTTGELSKPRIRTIFMNIVATVESLRERVTNVDSAVSILKDIYLGAKVEKFKSKVQDERELEVETSEKAELSKVLKELKGFQEKLKE